jgi:hypothetical protein
VTHDRRGPMQILGARFLQGRNLNTGEINSYYNGIMFFTKTFDVEKNWQSEYESFVISPVSGAHLGIGPYQAFTELAEDPYWGASVGK